MKAASLCMGIGGLDLAVEAVYGAELAWCAEYEPAPSAVIARHWPGVPNLHDLTAIDWAECEPIDILSAGYPCQPFSHAGKRKGAEDARHLWPYIAEAVRVLRPRRVVLENVAGHLTLGFGDVLRDLAEAGFDAEWCVLRASDVGAPHGRARVWIVAQDARVCGDRAEAGDQARGQDPEGPAGRPGGSDRRPGLTLGSSGREGGLNLQTAVALLPTPTAQDSVGSRNSTARRSPDAKKANIGDTLTDAMYLTFGAPPGVKVKDGTPLLPTPTAGEPGGTVEQYHERLRRSDGRTSSFTPLGMLAPTLDVEWGKYEPAIRRWEALTRPAPAPTIDGKLSSRFVEWMQGYPEGWVDGLTRTQALKALGNAVVPQQGAAAVQLLEAAHGSAEVAA